MNGDSVVSSLMVRASIFVAFSATLLPFQLGAQTPAQRTILEAFRDSVDRATDSAGLAGLEARIVAAMRRNRASPNGSTTSMSGKGRRISSWSPSRCWAGGMSKSRNDERQRILPR